MSRGAIRMKAKSDFKDSYPQFKASAGWCTRFMNRHNLSLRTRTKISQKLPRDLDDKITSFHSYIIEQCTNYDYPLANIANMGETPMFFDLPSNRTVHPRGDHTIHRPREDALHSSSRVHGGWYQAKTHGDL